MNPDPTLAVTKRSPTARVRPSPPASLTERLVRKVLPVGFALLLILAGAYRIVDSYGANSVTADERSHIGAGVQWLKEGIYTYEPKHPPLPRILVALGPHLLGLTNFEPQGKARDGDSVLFARGDPARNLRIARIGILPFYFFACLVVYLWAKKLGGWGAAISALVLFTSAPPILAHAGLATTDMASASTLLASLFVFYLWLENPSFLRSALLGASCALALLTKMSAILFVPVGFAAIAAAMGAVRVRERRLLLLPSGCSGGRIAITIAVGFLVLWAGYRFSFDSLDNRMLQRRVDATFAPGSVVHSLAWQLTELPIPAPEFVRGVKQLAQHGRRGHLAYLLGQTSQQGWWYFFPVAFLVKTPVAFLILIVVGVFAVIRRMKSEPRRGALALVVCAAAVLASVLPSTINIGVRHILSLYGMTAIIGGLGAASLWHADTQRYLKRAVVVGLLGWAATASIAAHPQHIPYFNVLARLTDDPILIDSDRDWGQAVHLLKEHVTKNRITAIRVAILGVRKKDLERYDFASLEPFEQTRGWIAISYYRLYLVDGYQWLFQYEPVEILGKSILIFQIPQTESRSRRRLLDDGPPASPIAPL